MNPYLYPGEVPAAKVELAQSSPAWSRYTVTFPSAKPTRYPENNTVTGEYFQPRNGSPTPLVIMMHGMSDQLLIPCKLFARAFARHGIASFVLYTVFHSKRMPETVKARIHHLTPEEWFESYQISVTDIRQVIDWASQRPEISKDEIGVLGISFGGFISAIAMGIDKRIRSGVFIISGGNGDKIARLSRKGALKRGYHKTESDYRQSQSELSQFLNEVTVKGWENATPPKKGFLVEPLTFAHALRQRPVLMVNARWDEYIPREAALDLWHASGKPEIAWYPATHTTIWLWYPFISRKIIRFFKSSLNHTAPA